MLFWAWVIAEVVSTWLVAMGIVTGVRTLHRHRGIFSHFQIKDVFHGRADAIMWIMVVASTFGCFADLTLRAAWVEMLGWRNAPYEWRILFLMFVHSALGVGASSWHIFVDRMLQKRVFCFLCRKPL